MKVSLKIIAFVLAAVMCLSLFGCTADESEYRDFNYFVMDTYITLRLARKTSDGTVLTDSYLEKTADECEKILAKIDLAISSHNTASDVYALNTDINKMLSPSEDLLAVLETANVIRNLTGGVFDYTLGALIELWNVNAGGPVPDAADISTALSHTGPQKFLIKENSITKLDPQAKLDFGGIGKGIAAQRLLEYLSTTDVEYGIVSLGGNIGVFGTNPDHGDYKIGLKNPFEETGVAGYLYITSGFVSVSGDSERYFEENGVRYHHILDPRTGRPADSGLSSVAVHTANGALSDALSTALFILGYEKSMELYESGSLDFEAVFINADGDIRYTPGIADHFEGLIGS